ncbi:hypothetical protein RchiOBHm_Chr5g0034431 [Rosa chinensis]|uniref:Uncharacterized protein n=1 Tax=Rosa chinensis TaxID=74649 RepID=A0A2P6QB07_ROSCH|nr:hypothetical protein RchiOBHm_Chr5g0034431 [Rosa chinensis]
MKFRIESLRPKTQFNLLHKLIQGEGLAIGKWDEAIGTCLLFKEEVVPVVHEEKGPSEANSFAGKCIVDQNQSSSKQNHLAALIGFLNSDWHQILTLILHLHRLSK